MKPTLAALLALSLVPALLAPEPARANPLGITRCVNLGDALDSPRLEGEWSYAIEERDLDLIAAAGFDTVRLPVRFSTRWDGARVDPEFLARVDEVILQALDRDLKVILDLHHFEDLMTDAGDQPQTLLAIWAALGDHYAGWPDDLYFELLNEPNERMTTARVVPLFQEIVADLRTDHPTRWIILEGGTWASLDEMFALPDFGPYTAHSFHYYAPFDFTHQQLWYDPDPMPARIWHSPTERAAIDADIARAATHGAPVFLGEFGTYRSIDIPSRMAWLGAVRKAAETHDIGWCVWSFASNFGLVMGDKSDWLPGVPEALGLDVAQ